MSLVAFVDTEATETSQGFACVEIGIVLFDIELAVQVGSASFLCYNEDLIEQTSAIHKIPRTAIEKYGMRFGYDGSKILVSDILSLFALRCDCEYLVSHQKSFEQDFIENDLDIPWLCTIEDFDLFPTHYTGARNLYSLAQVYGVPIVQSHRAIWDTLPFVEIFKRIPTIHLLEPNIDFLRYNSISAAFDWAMSEKLEMIAPTKWGVEKYKEEGWEVTIPAMFRWNPRLNVWEGRRISGEDKQFGQSKDGKFIPYAFDYAAGKTVKAIAKDFNVDKSFFKDWGFTWDTVVPKQWGKLINPDLKDIYPFNVIVPEKG